MSLRNEIVGVCDKCGRTGYVDQTICACLLKFRAYNKLVYRGFSKKLLDFILSPDCPALDYVSGKTFVDHYLTHVADVERQGLSLYIYSRERGRGKTSLAHFIAYRIALLFSSTENYRRESSLSFQFVTANALLNAEITATYFVLDDLGNEDKSGWKREAFLSALQDLLQYRRTQGLPTIITSNYYPGDLSHLYSGVLDSLLEIASDGCIQGSLFRQVELGGAVDLRLYDNGGWPE